MTWKNFSAKKIWVKSRTKNYWIQKNLRSRKILEQKNPGQTNLGSRKIYIWYIFWSEKFSILPVPTWLDLSLLDLNVPTWLYLSQQNSTRLDLIWHVSDWLDLSWLDIAWYDLSWLDLSQLDQSQHVLFEVDLTRLDLFRLDLFVRWIFRLDLSWLELSHLEESWIDTSTHAIQKPFRHHPGTLQTPSRHPSDTIQAPFRNLQTLFRHSPYILKTLFRHPQDSQKFQTCSSIEARWGSATWLCRLGPK